MAVIVKRFNVRAGGRNYYPGEIISGLSEDKEKFLVADGYCEYPLKITEAGPTGDNPPTDVPPEDGLPNDSPSEDGPATGHPLVGGK